MNLSTLLYGIAYAVAVIGFISVTSVLFYFGFVAFGG